MSYRNNCASFQVTRRGPNGAPGFLRQRVGRDLLRGLQLIDRTQAGLYFTVGRAH